MLCVSGSIQVAGALDGLRDTVLQCAQIHLDQPAGDVLVFLTGQEEIEALARLITARWRCAAMAGTKCCSVASVTVTRQNPTT